MDLVARRDGYVEGVGTWIGEDRNHSFVRRLAAHKANGNDVALITPTIDFPKTWKKWVLYLSPSGEHNSVMHDNGDANMVSIESWRVTPSFYLRFRIYEYVYLRNSWPLNFDYLFLGTPCISPKTVRLVMRLLVYSNILRKMSGVNWA